MYDSTEIQEMIDRYRNNQLRLKELMKMLEDDNDSDTAVLNISQSARTGRLINKIRSAKEQIFYVESCFEHECLSEKEQDLIFFRSEGKKLREIGKIQLQSVTATKNQLDKICLKLSKKNIGEHSRGEANV